MAATLAESALLPRQSYSKPLASAALPGGAYVLHIAPLPDGAGYALAASGPSHAIHLFDARTLAPRGQLAGHPRGITALRDSAHGLISCGRDGVLRAWDARAGAESLRLSAPSARALLCADAAPDGHTLAAGSELAGDDARIVFWDARSPAAPLRQHTATHADDVTAVHFVGKRVLLSAGTDGLVCTSDPDEGDEDEAGIAVGNWGCSVAQCGAFAGGKRIWAASDMETFSVWSNELDLLHDSNIRDPSVHTLSRTWVTDYIISCHTSATSDELSAFVGSNEGDIALLAPGLSGTDLPWTLHALWTGAHAGVVRSAFYDAPRGVLLTGGEDAKLHVWSAPPLLRATNASEDAMDVDAEMAPSGAWKRGAARMEGEYETKKARKL